MADTFRVQVNIEITKATGDNYYQGERLTVNDQFVIPAGGFAELAGIIGRFHALAEKVKAEYQPESEAT